MSTKQLPFPTGSFEMIHCSRCRIDFHENDGIFIRESGRLLRSNGYFVYSAPPAYRKDKDFPVIWDKLVNLTTAMCWRLIAHKVQTAIWIKENSQPSCLLQNAKQKVTDVCDVDDESKPSWNIPLKNCIQVRKVTKPLLETSRKGYLDALSASSYSYVSLLKHFLPIINPGRSSISLTYIASERIIPGYGGGMSSAKAALESDTRVLAFEAGRKRKIRVNIISAGPLRSRAARAIGFIDMMIDYSIANAPLQKELSAEEVGNAASFLASPLASAITGTVLYVDNGLNAMGVGVDSPISSDLNIPKEQH
ncbi:hypothetical protein KIW84_074372 [Lathyrus oleraceus]|uniref:Uncharacterized protein n=1 Tax=Pisum sativum TaxID=3888 RepID=A0A9D4VU17_PEA|nr:hypothetical protein KIW84_074372 [Pisum sativum]